MPDELNVELKADTKAKKRMLKSGKDIKPNKMTIKTYKKGE